MTEFTRHTLSLKVRSATGSQVLPLLLEGTDMTSGEFDSYKDVKAEVRLHHRTQKSDFPSAQTSFRYFLVSARY